MVDNSIIIKNRIVSLEVMDVSALLDNEGNFRVHPINQSLIMKAAVEEVGIASPLIVYRSERNNWQLTIIDGHLRKGFGGKWPVIITDLNDSEADKVLATHDRIGLLAQEDEIQLNKLLETFEFEDVSLNMIFEQDNDAINKLPESIKSSSEIPEMEILPYEHYDYILVLCRKTFDWNNLCQRLGLHMEKDNRRSNKKYGVGRAIDASVLLQLLEEK